MGRSWAVGPRALAGPQTSGLGQISPPRMQGPASSWAMGTSCGGQWSHEVLAAARLGRQEDPGCDPSREGAGGRSTPRPRGAVTGSLPRVPVWFPLDGSSVVKGGCRDYSWEQGLWRAGAPDLGVGSSARSSLFPAVLALENPCFCGGCRTGLVNRMRWLDGIIGSVDMMSLSKLLEMKDREAQHGAVRGVAKS